MSVTQAQLDKLVKAWAQGALTVEYGDSRITYRSRQDLEAQIARVAAALGVQSPLQPQAGYQASTVGFAVFNRG